MEEYRDDINRIESSKWKSTFKDKQTKKKYAFNVFLCDLDTCEYKQKYLLHKIIFDDFLNPQYWYDYVLFLWENDVKNHKNIRRIVNVALDCIEQDEQRSSDPFVQMRLLFIKSSSRCPIVQYKQLQKERVGLRTAQLYLDWSVAERAANNIEGATEVIAMGLREQALPRELLKEELKKYQVESQATTSSHFPLSSTCPPPSAAPAAGGAKKERKLLGSSQRLPRQPPPTHDPPDESVVLVKRPRTKTRGVASIPEEKGEDDSDREEEEEEGPTATARVELVAEAVRAASSSSSASSSASDRSQLREKYVASIASVDLSRRRQAKRPPPSASSDSSSNSVSQPLVKRKTRNLDQDTGGSSDSRAVGGDSGRLSTSSSLSSASSDDDADTVHESAKPASAPAAARAVAAATASSGSGDSDTSSSDMDFLTIVEGDLPRSVPLLQPAHEHGKASRSSGSSSSSSRRRVSFVGGEGEEEEEEAPLESLLHSGDDVPAVETPAPPPAKHNARSHSTHTDEEIDVKKMKAAKKRKTTRSSVAETVRATGEAASSEIKRIELNGRGYMQLSVLGRGASCTVHRVMATDATCKQFAYKRVDMRSCGSEEEREQTMASYCNEIELLERCRGSPHIIELVDFEVNREQAFVAMLMEAGEMDLSGALASQKQQRKRYSQSGHICPLFLRSVWGGMLRAVHHIHEARIVHGDLKPANFVFVRGELKLIDFGISKRISGDTTNIERDSLMGTINYMAPEALMPSLINRDMASMSADGDDDEGGGEEERKKVKYGRASDIWSLGCILYQMVYGATPFASIKSFPSKISTIVSPLCEIQYPPQEDEAAEDAIRLCLVRDLQGRARIGGSGGLLQHRLLQAPWVGQDKVQGGRAAGKMTSAGTMTDEDLQQQQQQQKSAGGGVSLERATSAVELVLEKRDAVVRGAITRRELYQQVCALINAPSSPQQSGKHPPASPSRGARTVTTTARRPLRQLPQSLVEQIRLQKSNTEGSPGQQQNGTNSDKENATGNQKQSSNSKAAVFVPGMVTLKALARSDSSRWMRPRGLSPEKADMKSHLEKSLGHMRHFLKEEADDTVDDTHHGDDSFSFF